MTGKIKIVSGWSRAGGSTHAHINLCNLFNERGLDCIFYGPHDWHLSKCKSALLKDLALSPTDTIISHFIVLEAKVCKRHIYSCHETNIAPVKQLNLNNYDLIHYVSDSQKAWHGVNYKSVVIPNVLPTLKKSPLGTGTAGVIGSIDPHKQTHLSIQRALDDGWKRVLVYGGITDQLYFVNQIMPILGKNWNVSIMNQVDDKQKIYDSVDCVYHSSKRETFNYIKAECELTGVSYKALSSAESSATYLDSNTIFDEWMKIL